MISIVVCSNCAFLRSSTVTAYTHSEDASGISDDDVNEIAGPGVLAIRVHEATGTVKASMLH